MHTYTIEKPIISCANVLGESPLWDSAKKTLFWVDIELGLLYEYLPELPLLNVHKIGQKLGCIALTETEHLLLATELGFAFYRPGDAFPQSFLDIIPRDSGAMFNDGKISPSGDFWVGSKGPRGLARLYRLNHDLTVDLILEGLSISNGIAWSLDNRFFYHTDLFDRCIYRYDLVNNLPINREVFYTPPIGTPDGLALDTAGNLWIAIWDGSRVVQLSPDGEELAQILLPVSRPTSVAFGGLKMRTLYITSASVDLSEDEKSAQPYAGALFSVEVGAEGLPTGRFHLRASQE